MVDGGEHRDDRDDRSQRDGGPFTHAEARLSDPLHPLLFVILGGAVVVMFGNRSATTAAPSTVSGQRSTVNGQRSTVNVCQKRSNRGVSQSTHGTRAAPAIRSTTQ